MNSIKEKCLYPALQSNFLPYCLNHLFCNNIVKQVNRALVYN